MGNLVTIKQYADYKGCIVQNIYAKINRGTFERAVKKIGSTFAVVISDEEYEQIKASKK